MRRKKMTKLNGILAIEQLVFWFSASIQIRIDDTDKIIPQLYKRVLVTDWELSHQLFSKHLLILKWNKNTIFRLSIRNNIRKYMSAHKQTAANLKMKQNNIFSLFHILPSYFLCLDALKRVNVPNFVCVIFQVSCFLFCLKSSPFRVGTNAVQRSLTYWLTSKKQQQLKKQTGNRGFLLLS